MTAEPSPPSLQAAHVLIVDDDPRVRTMLARYLAGKGFRLGEAGDGAAMRAYLARESVGLVVTVV